MKFFLALLIITICFFGCKKESQDTTSLNATLAGKWELRSETVAAGTGPVSSVPAGNGDIYLFNQNGTYTHYTAGQVYDSGTYIIQLNVIDISFGGAKVDFIRFSGTKSTFVLKLSTNTFSLSEDDPNAIASGFVKLP